VDFYGKTNFQQSRVVHESLGWPHAKMELVRQVLPGNASYPHQQQVATHKAAAAAAAAAATTTCLPDSLQQQCLGLFLHPPQHQEATFLPSRTNPVNEGSQV